MQVIRIRFRSSVVVVEDTHLLIIPRLVSPTPLILQRPAMMTPRTPASPQMHEDALHSPLYMHSPHTPLTPMVLLSPSADAAGFPLGVAAALGGGSAGHATTEVLAVPGSAAFAAVDLESLQVGRG